MRKFKNELIMSDPIRKEYRVLESDTWFNYFAHDKHKNNVNLNNIIAYHWRKVKTTNTNINSIYDYGDISHFTLSTKFRCPKSSRKKILLFLLITFTIGAFGGVGGNYLTKFVSWSMETLKTIEITEQ